MYILFNPQRAHQSTTKKVTTKQVCSDPDKSIVKKTIRPGALLNCRIFDDENHQMKQNADNAELNGRRDRKTAWRNGNVFQRKDNRTFINVKNERTDKKTKSGGRRGGQADEGEEKYHSKSLPHLECG